MDCWACLGCSRVIPTVLRGIRSGARTAVRFAVFGCATSLALACAGSSESDSRGAPDVASPSASTSGPFLVAVASDAIAAADDVGVDLVSVTNESLARVADLLPGLGKVVNVEVGHVVPEVGIGGSTDPRGEVSVRIKDAEFIEADQLRVWLPDTLAHEAHHSVRTQQGPGTGTTLGEKIVSEGLATVFAREAFPDTPLQPWAQALDDTQARDLWAQAQPLLDQPLTYAQFSEWFLGTGLLPPLGTGHIPRWAGYTLGVGIVNAYLSNHPGATAATLVREPAVSIIAGSGYKP
jgi:hypothetical protein